MCWKAWCPARTGEDSAFIKRSLEAVLLSHRGQVRAVTVSHLCRYAEDFAVAKLFGVGVEHAWNEACIKLRGCEYFVALRSPAMTSAAKCAPCTALCAKMGSLKMLPITKMCGTLVRIWMLTLMKPQSVTDSLAFSAASFLPLSLRLTA